MERYNYGSLFGKIADTALGYLNTRVDGYKLKAVENLSLLSSRILVILIATMLGAVMLQLMGFALAFIIGDLIGSTAWGFIIVTLLYGEALLVIYLCRNTLFMNKMIQMYMRMFFGSSRQSRNNLDK